VCVMHAVPRTARENSDLMRGPCGSGGRRCCTPTTHRRLMHTVLLFCSGWLAGRAAFVQASGHTPASAAGHSTGPWPRCRCLPHDACWQRIDWAALNASVHGRLEISVDEMQSCIDDLHSDACSQSLEGSDDEFWLASKPNGYQHTGQFGLWNLTTQLSAYVVRAETEEDFQAAVAFAAAHDLRLVIKGAGHDWYGRSAAAGALLLWTHERKSITWHDAFVPLGAASAGVPAVTVQSGVQFADLYPAAQARPYPGDALLRRTIVMGGGCDSVGVGGCWLGGCYNVFTKKFGDGATNLLEARVVLANGTLITTSEHSHPDVFWTLRGGGGGNVAVVTEFTARTHPAPLYTMSSAFRGQARDLVGFKALLRRVLQLLAESNHWPLDQQCTSGAPRWNVTALTAELGCRHYEGDTNKTAALYQSALQWCQLPAQQDLGLTCTAHAFYTWNQSDYKAHNKIWDNASFIPQQWIGNEPWISFHADREISTSLVGSLSKYIPMRGCTDPEKAAQIVNGIVQIETILKNMSRVNGGIHVLNGPTGDKSQSGMPPEIEARFNRTALNPVLLQAPAFWLIMINIPWLPQLEPTSRLMKSLWPRLRQYAVLSDRDPLWSRCEMGAGGDEVQARACMAGWRARVPQLRAQVAAIRDILWKIFPNELDGEPFSGSYWNEADYEDPHWQVSHWGVHYPRLLALKQNLDPQGLFYGHHAVGSELWSDGGNCRIF
jgi:FAD/FMN-containing dehydrogenase